MFVPVPDEISAPGDTTVTVSCSGLGRGTGSRSTGSNNDTVAVVPVRIADAEAGDAKPAVVPSERTMTHKKRRIGMIPRLSEG